MILSAQKGFERMSPIKYKQHASLNVFGLLSAKKGNKEHGSMPNLEEGGLRWGAGGSCAVLQGHLEAGYKDDYVSSEFLPCLHILALGRLKLQRLNSTCLTICRCLRQLKVWRRLLHFTWVHLWHNFLEANSMCVFLAICSPTQAISLPHTAADWSSEGPAPCSW